MTMALLHSGLTKEDVELVSIETADFSLIIKGKPFHQKYEGLRQYKEMNNTDTMLFKVNGQDVERVFVYNIDKQQSEENYLDLRPVFFENGIYQIIVSPKNNKELSFYHEYPLLRNAVDKVNMGNSYVLLGNLQFQSEIGYSTFEIREGENTLLEVTLEIFPTKLDYKNDYRKLLNEVNDEIYNLAFHFLRKTYQSAKTRLEGNPSPAEFFRLLSAYFDSFLKALDQIERQPHHELEKTHELVRGNRLKNLDNRGRNYLRKNSHLFKEVNKGIGINGKQYMPIRALSAKKEVTYNTLENRLVKWMMKRTILKLDNLLHMLKRKGRWGEADQSEEVYNLVAKMKTKLKARISSPFWKVLPDPNQHVFSLVLQLAPGYREAYQIFLTLSKGLTLQNSIYKMSVKDVATLYEYWTYLKLGQILGRRYELVSQDIIKVNRDGLYVNLQANQQATRVYKHPITSEKIILTYQKYENRLPTIAQKPDTMLTIEKKGEKHTFSYIFDAKYRVDFAADGTYYGNRYKTPGPMEDDINTMHRYRDSIVAENNGPYERTAFGAYVLFPWNGEEDYEDQHFYKSIDKVNIGGFPFLPNATNLVERFVENLIEKSADEIQKEGILPRGTLEKWKESIEEKVLVGVISTFEDYRRYLYGLTYKIPTSLLRKGWQEAKYVALYLTKEVGRENGVVCYGKIVDVEVDGKYVLFSVSEWKELEMVIQPVGYGIATYMMTTLQDLKSARELPELFMKSEEEKLVWKMLRRVSSSVSVKLDKWVIDEANVIDSFGIEDMEISFVTERQMLVLKTRKGYIDFSVLEIKKYPLKVFRGMRELF